ncbi:MAG: hypothetical protein ACT4NL_06835 [Pseudomarimonas sp.]
MIVSWYVVPQGDRFTVLRGAKPHGTHDTRQRAIDGAVFMARIEADKQGYIGEVFVEDPFGRMVQQLVIGPREANELPAPQGPNVRHVGLDRVLVSA